MAAFNFVCTEYKMSSHFLFNWYCHMARVAKRNIYAPDGVLCVERTFCNERKKTCFFFFCPHNAHIVLTLMKCFSFRVRVIHHLNEKRCWAIDLPRRDGVRLKNDWWHMVCFLTQTMYDLMEFVVQTNECSKFVSTCSTACLTTLVFIGTLFPIPSHAVLPAPSVSGVLQLSHVAKMVYQCQDFRTTSNDAISNLRMCRG